MIVSTSPLTEFFNLNAEKMAHSKNAAGGKGSMTGNREDVIETLIDMDPCGAAYRVSKTMVRIFLS